MGSAYYESCFPTDTCYWWSCLCQMQMDLLEERACGSNSVCVWVGALTSDLDVMDSWCPASVAGPSLPNSLYLQWSWFPESWLSSRSWFSQSLKLGLKLLIKAAVLAFNLNIQFRAYQLWIAENTRSAIFHFSHFLDKQRVNLEHRWLRT